MRKSFWVLALLAIFAFVLPVKAQDEAPRAELYAGYDYVRVNSSGTSSNFNGGSGQFTYNVNNWLGAVGDLGGYYTSNGFGAGIFSYLFGPRINFRGHGKVTPYGAVKLVDGLAGESPAGADCPVGTVVISGDGAGNQTVESPEVNVLVG